MRISNHPLAAEIFASTSTGFLWKVVSSSLERLTASPVSSAEGGFPSRDCAAGGWRNEFETGVQIVAEGKALREDVQKELEKQGRPPVKGGNWHLIC